MIKVWSQGVISKIKNLYITLSKIHVFIEILTSAEALFPWCMVGTFEYKQKKYEVHGSHLKFKKVH